MQLDLRPNLNRIRDGRLIDLLRVLPGLALAVGAVGWFAIQNVRGWTYLPFGDEASHMLGALAMHAGDVLYRDYIDAHGPVVFMLTQLYGVLTNWYDITYARTVSTVLTALAGLAIGFSPALRNVSARLRSGCSLAVLAASG